MCEIPATARGNHFRTVVCLGSLDSLDMFFCCTGIRLLVEEQKMAETVLADLIITEFIGIGLYLPTYPWRYLSLGRVLEWFPAWPNV